MYGGVQHVCSRDNVKTVNTFLLFLSTIKWITDV